MKECRYTVCRPVQTTMHEDGDRDLLPDGHRDGLPRGLRDGLRPADRRCSRSAATVGEWVTSRYCVPGKTICVNGCLVSVPRRPSAARQVWCPRTVVENVCCTVYEPQVVPQAGAVDHLQAGAGTA